MILFKKWSKATDSQMAAGRISPIAPPGSLLKTSGKPPKGRAFVQGAVHNDAKYLALVRRCPCLSCDAADPAGVAAHVRMTRLGKPITGAGLKPGDHWTLPLCAQCHTEGPGAQHRVGEVRFWADLGLDPLPICQQLYAASPSLGAMRAVVFAEREKRR
jgi:hypothetical protein